MKASLKYFTYADHCRSCFFSNHEYKKPG